MCTKEVANKNRAEATKKMMAHNSKTAGMEEAALSCRAGVEEARLSAAAHPKKGRNSFIELGAARSVGARGEARQMHMMPLSASTKLIHLYLCTR